MEGHHHREGYPTDRTLAVGGPNTTRGLAGTTDGHAEQLTLGSEDEFSLWPAK